VSSPGRAPPGGRWKLLPPPSAPPGPPPGAPCPAAAPPRHPAQACSSSGSGAPCSPQCLRYYGVFKSTSSMHCAVPCITCRRCKSSSIHCIRYPPTPTALIVLKDLLGQFVQLPGSRWPQLQHPHTCKTLTSADAAGMRRSARSLASARPASTSSAASASRISSPARCLEHLPCWVGAVAERTEAQCSGLGSVLLCSHDSAAVQVQPQLGVRAGESAAATSYFIDAHLRMHLSRVSPSGTVVHAALIHCFASKPSAANCARSVMAALVGMMDSIDFDPITC
jgi:hypothetical protein